MGIRENSPKGLHPPSVSEPPRHVTVIDVANVTPSRKPYQEVPYKDAVEAQIAWRPGQFFGGRERAASPPGSGVEACSRYHGQLVAHVAYHPFVAAVDMAFRGHQPLVLSPDMLWLLIAQGFASHVNANAAELRRKLVDHEGQVQLSVRRDDFFKGSPENPWPEVFGELSRGIREHIGATTHDLLLPSFSTTGATERAAAEVVLLEAMRSMFTVEFVTRCGIPQVILEGTPDDWESLARRTCLLGQYRLRRWAETLAPILEELIAAARGVVNVPFWQSIYKLHDRSGGSNINGWIIAFFPYLKDAKTGLASRRNPGLRRGGKGLQEVLSPWAEEPKSPGWRGPTTEDFPSGLAKAPFHWTYSNRSYEMEFLAGFVGVQQDPVTLRLRPEIGWAVREQTASEPRSACK